MHGCRQADTFRTDMSFKQLLKKGTLATSESVCPRIAIHLRADRRRPAISRRRRPRDPRECCTSRGTRVNHGSSAAHSVTHIRISISISRWSWPVCVHTCRVRASTMC